MLQLILHASLPVQLVMMLLLFASVASWVIILRKKRVLDRAEKEADAFEEPSGPAPNCPSSTPGHRAQPRRRRPGSDLRSRLARVHPHPPAPRRGCAHAARRRPARHARGGCRAKLDGLERNLEFLANVGSISPYVGLFGTVWGIMISFQGLATMKEATIATVAPGISEALIATAMGLFAAIPAVWAYNRYATRVERMAVRYETFSEEFSSILQRQTHVDD